jgi:hypothetical protein
MVEALKCEFRVKHGKKVLGVPAESNCGEPASMCDVSGKLTGLTAGK